MVRLLLDLSRSVARQRHLTPSGIDRVERAYLDWALRGAGAHGLVRIGRRQYLIEPERLAELRAALDGEGAGLDLAARVMLWRDERLRRIEAEVRRLAVASAPAEGIAGLLAGHVGPGAVYLSVGHDNLDAGMMGAMRAAGVQPVVMIHDVIPLDYPELSRPETPGRFLPKLAAAAEAAHLIFNSEDTARRAEAAAARHGLNLPGGAVLPLGIGALPRAQGGETRAAFVCLGTIEARKNHLLLLSIWRRFWEARAPEATPQLHIVGRRGWECEQVLDHLDRAPMVGVTVFEHAALDDAGLGRLLATARALLFPSLAEGYGLPLAEALAAGVPVIAADLPALREVGGDVPDWLDPLDGPGWQRAVEDYAASPSERRFAQLTRIAGWRAPAWTDHFVGLEVVLAGLGD